MLAEARRIGSLIVEKEQDLDRRFDHRQIDEEVLRELSAEIAALSGELRFGHLRAHLETAAALEPDQIDAYDRLRGYRPSPNPE